MTAAFASIQREKAVRARGVSAAKGVVERMARFRLERHGLASHEAWGSFNSYTNRLSEKQTTLTFC